MSRRLFFWMRNRLGVYGGRRGPAKADSGRRRPRPRLKWSQRKRIAQMADINLTQGEADKLMAMEKRAVDEKDWLFPAPGDRLAIPLASLD